MDKAFTDLAGPSPKRAQSCRPRLWKPADSGCLSNLARGKQPAKGTQQATVCFGLAGLQSETFYYYFVFQNHEPIKLRASRSSCGRRRPPARMVGKGLCSLWRASRYQDGDSFHLFLPYFFSSCALARERFSPSCRRGSWIGCETETATATGSCHAGSCHAGSCHAGSWSGSGSGFGYGYGCGPCSRSRRRRRPPW